MSYRFFSFELNFICQIFTAPNDVMWLHFLWLPLMTSIRIWKFHKKLKVCKLVHAPTFFLASRLPICIFFFVRFILVISCSLSVSFFPCLPCLSVSLRLIILNSVRIMVPKRNRWENVIYNIIWWPVQSSLLYIVNKYQIEFHSSFSKIMKQNPNYIRICHL